jgi:aspartate aminotransferase
VAGLVELRVAVCRQSQRRRGVAVTPEQVVVTTGAKHALFLLAEALYNPGDQVLIPTPAWVSYPDQITLMGAEPVLVPCLPDQGFRLDIQALRARLTPATKALILCTPNNPTGGVLAEAELLAVAELAREAGLWIIVDEIYAELTYDGFTQPSLLALAPDLADRIIVVDGVSKTYAMTGFRIGWLIAPKAVAQACAALQSQSTTHPDTIAQHAALAALTGPAAPIEKMRLAFQARRDAMLAQLPNVPGLNCALHPTGAFYVWADVSGWVGRRTPQGRILHDDLAIAEWLLQDAEVAVVPGSAFFAPGYLRMSFANSDARIEQALSRMAAAAAGLA